MIGENEDDSALSEAGKMDNLATLKSGLSEVCMINTNCSCLVYAYYFAFFYWPHVEGLRY